MNYLKHYNDLIERAKNRKLDCYKEIHHIIPRCIGGTDEKENLVALTGREHFVAHILLVKIYPKDYGLIKAVNMMCISSDNQSRVHNRMYGWLRERFSEAISIQSSIHQKGEGNSQFGRVWVYDLAQNVPVRILSSELDLYLSQNFIAGKKRKECYCGNVIRHTTASKYCCAACKDADKVNVFGKWKGKKHTNETKKKISHIKKNTGIGKENSQFGTIWICSNKFKKSKKIHKDDIIPDDWEMGRYKNCP